MPLESQTRTKSQQLYLRRSSQHQLSLLRALLSVSSWCQHEHSLRRPAMGLVNALQRRQPGVWMRNSNTGKDETDADWRHPSAPPPAAVAIDRSILTPLWASGSDRSYAAESRQHPLRGQMRHSTGFPSACAFDDGQLNRCMRDGGEMQLWSAAQSQLTHMCVG